MADFVKKTWACGDSITADELNRMENGIEEAVECCGGGSAGYECKEEWATLTDESVTTVLEEGIFPPQAKLVYSTEIDAEAIRVTFDGVEYICEKIDGGYGALYNEETDSMDWSTYPFIIYWDLNGNYLDTETAGTYQVKIEALGETAETSECFKKAVKAVTGNTEPLIVDVLTSGSTWRVSSDAPWQVIHDEYVKGRTILFQEIASSQKKDAFGSVVSVIGNAQSENYYIDVYVQGQLRRFSASAPNLGATYRAAS